MSDCLFCKIIAGQIPSKKEYEDEETFAFHDINPKAPHHVLIIPKKHIAQNAEIQDGDAALAGKLMLRARDIAKKNGWQDYRLVMNNGEGAGQSVFHIHLHLLAGRRMTWPPG